MKDKVQRQRLAAAYGAGQIKQAQIAGEYPPPDVLGDLTPTGRYRRPPEMRWPTAYAMGTQKMSRVHRTDRATIKLVELDFNELEKRIAAWHATELGGGPVKGEPE